MATREAFARNDHERAGAMLPDPAEQRNLPARRREWLLKARVLASVRDRHSAEPAMEQAYAEGASTNLAVPLERAATHALVTAHAGEHEAATVHLRTATELLEQTRAEGYDYPADIDARGMETAVIDMAVAYAALGDTATVSALVCELQPRDASRRSDFRNSRVVTCARTHLPT